MLLWYHREQQYAHESTQRQTRTITSSTTLSVLLYRVSVVVIVLLIIGEIWGKFSTLNERKTMN